MRRAVLAGVGIAAAVLGGGLGSAAGSVRGVPAITVTGDLVPGGTAIVSGNGCVSTDAEGNLAPLSTATVLIGGGEPPAVIGAVPATLVGFGTQWSLPVELSTDAQPGATYTVSATCGQTLLGETSVSDYPDATFVMGSADPVDPTEPTAPDPVPVVPDATPPAAPEAAAPTFTG